MPRFSETLMDHFQYPRNAGRLENADAVGAAGAPGQGRYVILYVRAEEERISDARFECNGCGVTIACGSALTELIVGRTIDACRLLSAQDLEQALDGIPADKWDRAPFALHALADALRQLERPIASPPPSNGDTSQPISK